MQKQDYTGQGEVIWAIGGKHNQPGRRGRRVKRPERVQARAAQPARSGCARHPWLKKSPVKSIPKLVDRLARPAMKGVIFTEFLDMVEQQFSPQILDQIIVAAQLPSEGAYTAVGSYDHGEIWRLASELSRVSGTPVPELLRAYGEYLFPRLAAAHSNLLAGMTSAFDLLQSLDGVIHREVVKIYPDAELPRFQVVERTALSMTLLYESQRPFADLAEGLIRACGSHFGQSLAVTRESLPAEAAVQVRFVLTLR